VTQQIAASASQRGGGLMFPEFAARADEDMRITIEARQYAIVIERRGDQWVSIDRGDYPVRAEPAQQIIDAIAEMTAYEAKTDNPALFQEIDVSARAPI
jgi:hypothetical protein